MLRTIFCLLIAVPLLSAQTAGSKSELFRKEGPALQTVVNQAAGEVPGVSILQPSKATYIQEFGIVVSLEVSLEPPVNPFNVDVRPERSSVLKERQQKLRDKMKQVLAQRAPGLRTAGDDQFVVIAVHIFNSNPVDTPNLPQQIIVMVKKSEPSNIILREL
jgi:hypothetical protein